MNLKNVVNKESIFKNVMFLLSTVFPKNCLYIFLTIKTCIEIRELKTINNLRTK